jgi:hypothetical protein
MGASKPPLLVPARSAVEPGSLLRSCEKKASYSWQISSAGQTISSTTTNSHQETLPFLPSRTPQETAREKSYFLRLLMAGVCSWPLSFTNKDSLATTAVPSWIHSRTSAEALFPLRTFLCLAHVIDSLSRSCEASCSLAPSGPS